MGVILSALKSTELSQVALFILNMKAFILLCILALAMARPNADDDGFNVSGGTLNSQRDIIGKIGTVTNEPGSIQSFPSGSRQNLPADYYARTGGTTISNVKTSDSGMTSIGGDGGLGV